MIAYQAIIRPEGLYWGQPELTSWLSQSDRSELMNLEVRSWLSDLYWGEFFALRFARSRMENAPASRRKVWERISIDEIQHFALISNWFAERRVLPDSQNVMFRRLNKHVYDAESRGTEADLLLMGALQAFLEALIHRLIIWRKDLMVDVQLRELLERIAQDEVVHIHASLFEAKQSGSETSEYNLLSSHRSRLFPLHFAKQVLNLRDFKRARECGLQVVDRIILKGESA